MVDPFNTDDNYFYFLFATAATRELPASFQNSFICVCASTGDNDDNLWRWSSKKKEKLLPWASMVLDGADQQQQH